MRRFSVSNTPDITWGTTHQPSAERVHLANQVPRGQSTGTRVGRPESQTICSRRFHSSTFLGHSAKAARFHLRIQQIMSAVMTEKVPPEKWQGEFWFVSSERLGEQVVTHLSFRSNRPPGQIVPR